MFIFYSSFHNLEKNLYHPFIVKDAMFILTDQFYDLNLCLKSSYLHFQYTFHALKLALELPN